MVKYKLNFAFRLLCFNYANARKPNCRISDYNIKIDTIISLRTIFRYTLINVHEYLVYNVVYTIGVCSNIIHIK